MDNTMILLRLLYGILGCCVGSFLCLCAYRLPRDMSILWPGSHCDHCCHALGVGDLVPLVSYMLHRGRCRYCGAVVPPRYFWRELETGILFVLLGWQLQPGLELLARFLLVSSLLLTSWLDAEEHMIYQVVLGFSAMGILLQHYVVGSSPVYAAAGALAVGAFLGLIYRFHKKGMGLGDVAFGALLGLWLGPARGLGCIFLAALLALLYVLGRMGCGDREACYREIPFSPFLVLSALMLSYGAEALPWLHPEVPSLCFLGLAPVASIKEQVRKLLQKRNFFQLKDFLVLSLAGRQADLLEFVRTEEQLRLTRIGHVSAAREAASEDQALFWTQRLQELYARKGFQAKNVIVVLPWEDSQLRLLALPGLKGREQLEAARWEILQELPYEPGTFELAVQEVERDSGNTVAAAVQAHKLSLLRQLAVSLGWHLYKLEPAVTSWGRWLTQEPAAFCLTGSLEQPVLTAYVRGCPVFTELLPGGLEAAERINTLCGLWETALHWEENRALYLFAPQIWPQELISQLSHPIRWLHGELKIRLADYYDQDKAAHIPNWPELWGAALPAAGTGPVFRPGTLAERWRLWSPGLGKAAVVLTAASCFLAFSYKTAAQRQWQASAQGSRQLQGWADCWQQWTKREQAIRIRSSVVNQSGQKNMSWAGFFVLLGRMVPADCWVTRITQDKQGKGLTGLHLAGSTLHKDSALQLVQRLKQHPMIGEAKLEKLQQEGQNQTAGFNIFLTVKGGEFRGS